MFINGKIQAVNASGVQLRPQQSNKYVSRGLGAIDLGGAGKLEASVAGSSGPGVSVVGQWASEYQYMMSGILPADPLVTDYSSLRPFYRDMYLLDATAGSAVDIQSTFPFSDFQVKGLKTAELRPFEEALERLNIRRMMPEISVAYLVDGFFCGTLVFDPRTKQFMDTMIHDAMQCTVLNHPFYNVDPEIQVRVSGNLQRFLDSDSPYAQRYIKTLPKVFLNLLKAGQFTLDPIATLFVPRKGLTDRAHISYLHRLLPFYLLEKTLFRGTLTEAHKRQRALTHITAGDDNWTPSGEELFQLVQMFQEAEQDPLGGWITTRNAVQATDVRMAGDIWKWYEVLDALTPYKLRALQISESFLTGDASYAAAESAYQTFLEQMDSYRGHLTSAVFYQKIFPLIALVNGLYKQGYEKKKDVDVLDFLSNSNSRAQLRIPELVWKKQLESKDDAGVMEALEKLDEKGIPIPLKAWVAAAGQDFDSLITDLDEDPEIRKILSKHTEGQSEPDPDGEYASYYAGPGGAPSISVNSKYRRRVPLLAREWGDGLVSVPNRSGSGRKHIINQKAARTKFNNNLYKAMKAARTEEQRRNIILRKRYERIKNQS